MKQTKIINPTALQQVGQTMQRQQGSYSAVRCMRNNGLSFTLAHYAMLGRLPAPRNNGLTLDKVLDKIKGKSHNGVSFT